MRDSIRLILIGTLLLNILFLYLVIELNSLQKTTNDIKTKIETICDTTTDSVYVDTIKTDTISDEDLIEAIMEVESNGNPNAYNEGSGATGCMQIMPIMVNEVNRICKLTKTDLYFYPKDRWDCDKSKEMFMIWKNYHHENSDAETISRHWWGGPKYGEEDCSEFYWDRVKLNLEI